MSHAFWYCSCRHPGTKVYYANEMEKKQALYDELADIHKEMTSQRDEWKKMYYEARALLGAPSETGAKGFPRTDAEQKSIDRDLFPPTFSNDRGEKR